MPDYKVVQNVVLLLLTCREVVDVVLVAVFQGTLRDVVGLLLLLLLLRTLLLLLLLLLLVVVVLLPLVTPLRVPEDMFRCLLVRVRVGTGLR